MFESLKLKLGRNLSGAIRALAAGVSLALLTASLPAAEPLPDISGLPDDDFYELIQKRILDYFLEESIPGAGLVKDRANNFGKCYSDYASIAAAGMALGVFGAAESRGWLETGEAYERALRIVETYHSADENPDADAEGMVHWKGFFYHWSDLEGNPDPASEISTIDTAILVAGMLFAGEYFRDYDGGELLVLAEEVYERVDWVWMTNENPQGFLEWGWRPGRGFSEGIMGGFSEAVLAYILGAGAPDESRRLDDSGWNNMGRGRAATKSLEYIFEKQLFAHQYPLIFIDLAGRRDAHACYPANAYKATVHHRRYAHLNPSGMRTYSAYSWGLGGSDGPYGYRGYGIGDDDGTVALSNLGAAAPELPRGTADSLRQIYTLYGEQLWGKYGFCDSYNTDPSVSEKFNLEDMWRTEYAIGVQQGAVFLAIENLRSGLIRETTMRSEHIQDALGRLGFTENTAPPSPPGNPEARIFGDQVLLTWTAPGNSSDTGSVTDGIYEARFGFEYAGSPELLPEEYLDHDIIRNASFNPGESQEMSFSLREEYSCLLMDYTDAGFWIRAADDTFNFSPFARAEVIENLLRNPGFREGTGQDTWMDGQDLEIDHWGYYGGGWWSESGGDDPEAAEGVYMIKRWEPETGTYQDFYAQGGRPYVFSLYVYDNELDREGEDERLGEGSKVVLSVEWFDSDPASGGEKIETSVIDFLSGGGETDTWVKLEGVRTAPGEAAFGRFLITTETREGETWSGGAYYDGASLSIYRFEDQSSEVWSNGALISELTLKADAFEFPVRVAVSELTVPQEEAAEKASGNLPEGSLGPLTELRKYTILDEFDNPVTETTSLPGGIRVRFYYPPDLSRAQVNAITPVRLRESEERWEPLERYGEDRAAGWIETRLNSLSVLGILSYPFGSLEMAYVYPNPLRPGTSDYGAADGERGAVISNLPRKTRIRIFNIAGELVEEFEHTGGASARWAGAEKVSSGVYIISLSSGGERRNLKFALIR